MASTGRLFGTNGVRFLVDGSLEPDFILDVSLSIGTFYGGGRVVIGTDTRSSNELVRSTVTSGLLATGCDVLDIGVAPSPCIQLAARDLKCNGVIITASHNPPEFNGIKCVDAMGMEHSPESESSIERIFRGRGFKLAPWTAVGRVGTREYTDHYIGSIMSKVSVDAIRKAGFRVVVDCANGSACASTPLLLQKMGCEVVTLNSHPSGIPARPYEPTIENVGALMDTVRQAGAHVGIAHDGDADRAIFVDEKGTYVHGDRSLALCAKHVLREKKGLVVTPVSSSRCVEDAVRKEGGNIEFTKVGAPVVARTMLERGAVFGGEENGGLIFPEQLYARDGAMAAAKVLDIMAKRRMKLSSLLAEIPYYHQFKTSTRCPEEAKQPTIKRLAARLEKEGRDVVTIDGVKLKAKKGWVLIRPSGTESLIRIFAEAGSKKGAEDLANEGKDMVESCMEK